MPHNQSAFSLSDSFESGFFVASPWLPLVLTGAAVTHVLPLRSFALRVMILMPSAIIRTMPTVFAATLKVLRFAVTAFVKADLAIFRFYESVTTLTNWVAVLYRLFIWIKFAHSYAFSCTLDYAPTLNSCWHAGQVTSLRTSPRASEEILILR